MNGHGRHTFCWAQTTISIPFAIQFGGDMDQTLKNTFNISQVVLAGARFIAVRGDTYKCEGRFV